ncbi:MAG TPA: citrate synthase family protein [Gemmatimonadaceae bacterium]|nr:citrate synthase family protein [Gemmatimonadaceae bacterium]
MRPGVFLTAAETAETLGVTRATLYAYVSRGLVRSEPIPGRTRARRYYREDVERLTERKAARRDPARVAAQALRWGGPVLESGITLIQDGSFYYRGHDAIALAATSSVEAVAALLWGADETDAEKLFDQPSPLAPRHVARLDTWVTERHAALQAALPIAAAADLASLDLRPHAVRLTGARIMRLFAAIIARADAPRPLHDVLQSAWAPKRPSVGSVLRTALVLCADHELNISAFAARCAASAGASPYDVVAAALATLKGHRHGGAAARVLELVRHSGTPKQARDAIADRLRRGEAVPGFGHPLYPAGDPRATALLRLAAASGNAAAIKPFRNLLTAGSELLREEPNLDAGLAAVSRAYRLPDEAPFMLFTLGRTIGWIAHAIEEYASGRLIRPRARYVGPAPT